MPGGHVWRCRDVPLRSPFKKSVPEVWLAGSLPQLALSGCTAALKLRSLFFQDGSQSVTETGSGKGPTHFHSVWYSSDWQFCSGTSHCAVRNFASALWSDRCPWPILLSFSFPRCHFHINLLHSKIPFRVCFARTQLEYSIKKYVSLS